MRLGRLAAMLAVSGALAACQIFDPAPHPSSPGPWFLFAIKPVRVGLAGCGELDPLFTRNHLVTVTGNSAKVAATGGIDMMLPEVAPGIFQSDLMRDNLRLVVAFDKQHQTRTLLISEATRGCRWYGEARDQTLPEWWRATWPATTDWWRGELNGK